ncbi:LuxR C-terminal-related transcriptional regulator [Streptomyces sp. NBC_00847]|uniref:LuxR C-terminal-related transcriptional regulator n=1 Tax=unclassified Streptomyces TaxID=2593676 RepID=UPI002250DFE0|nr:LuxR C-terminal-related transcriptional regulator [Streptomyces sp. NBC_00847]MCX4882357.1 LuxR C-terminal-related transcriptional regulator [Streptomyces sp. NBC_00847]
MIGIHTKRGLERNHVQVLSLISQGCTMGQVARRLDISDRTLRRRLRVICTNVAVETPIEAVVWAVRRGLI